MIEDTTTVRIQGIGLDRRVSLRQTPFAVLVGVTLIHPDHEAADRARPIARFAIAANPAGTLTKAAGVPWRLILNRQRCATTW